MYFIKLFRDSLKKDEEEEIFVSSYLLKIKYYQAFQNLKTVSNEVVQMKDKPNIPFVEATMNEVWRFCNISPISAGRMAHMDTPVGDYVIPAGAQILYNCYPLHMDKQYWGDPESFR